MAQAPTGTQVPVLGTVVLLLDDEAEAIGNQFLRLCQALDPVVQGRVQMLRVTQNEARQLVAMRVTDQQHQLVTADTYATRGAVNVMTFSSAQADPNATQTAANLPQTSHGATQDFESALHAAIQDALRIAGTDPLAEHGFALVPNELAVHLVGRVDAPLLAQVAAATQTITEHISAQTDARRFALLVAASPLDGNGRDSSPNHGAWQDAARRQPWDQMLSWDSHQPPLLYAFLFEAWDEAGRFHERPQLHYSVAEALFALFATGMLERREFKEAMDLSTAATEGTNGRMRVGSIGTSLITSPTQGMVDFLAYRLASDALLLRGLLGEEGAMRSPEIRDSLPQQTKDDAERWLRGLWQQRVFPDFHELPRGLPSRKLENGAHSTWHPLAISTAGPTPQAVLWRWQGTRRPLDQQQFWELAVQNEYETTGDVAEWRAKTEAHYQAIQATLRDELTKAIEQRTQMPEGIIRATEFTQSVRGLLAAEKQRLAHDAAEQQRQLDQHYVAFADLVRRHHPANGVTDRANPPARPDVPLMPNNLEALTHETLDTKFERVPMPATLILVAVVMALVGAVAVNAVPNIPGFAHWPTQWQMLFTGMNRHLVGIGAMLLLFVLASLGALVHFAQLRRWQRHFIGERMLLRLDQAKQFERQQMLDTLDQLMSDLELAQANLASWTTEIHDEAKDLTRIAGAIAEEFKTSPTLSRDIFIAQGTIWEGNHPEEFYLQLRARQPENRLILSFLQFVQARAGGVPNALNERRLQQLTLSFIYDYLRANAKDDPFTDWTHETAEATIARAVQAARVAIQPLPAGRPLGHFTAIMAHGSVNWVPRIAQEDHAVLLPAPTPHWCFVVRATTRAQHTLVQG